MITPTVGRVVLYRPNISDPSGTIAEPDTRYAAQIAYVHSEAMVNLGILDPNGAHFNKTSVALAQDRPAEPGECEWMPYQVGQAGREAELRAQLEKPVAAA